MVVYPHVIYLLLLLYSGLVATQDTEITEDASTDITDITSSMEPTIVTTPAPISVYLDQNQNSYTWSSGKPYHSGESIVVQTDDGYSINVTVKDVDLDGDNSDYLLIKSGTTLDDEGDGRRFTYLVANTQSFYYKTNTIFGQFVVNGDNPNNKGGFTVIFQRIDDSLLTTTPHPVTDPNWPTPSPSENANITVNVTVNLNTDYLLLFRTSVAQMASNYCQTENLYLSEPITYRNVLVRRSTRCPYIWVDSTDCVQITFALPVFLNESVAEWTAYQLNADHLLIMWTRLARKYLPTPDITVFDYPDAGGIVRWWAIAISLVTIGFVVLLGLSRMLGGSCWSGKYFRYSRRRTSDTVSIVSNGQKKDSHISLEPHYLQEIPKLFENEYSTYNTYA